MREIITIQVGQCGNQIGTRFWDLAMRDHAVHGKGLFDESMSTFFRNVDNRTGQDISFGSNAGETMQTMPVKSLKARCVNVDMEEGVLNNLLKGELGELFDQRQMITDTSGSGNNWAHGHEIYGPQYWEKINEALRRAAEHCDSLQCFFLMHSLGGGTGSGLGSYIMSMLQDEYPDIYRFDTCVFPSQDDDVITSPYNAVLSLHQLSEYADCVLPIENQALFDMATHVQSLTKKQKFVQPNEFKNQNEKKKKPFDQMNNIAANLLNNLTSSMRFEGNLNVDLNEITMNLVPFPRMHYLIPSLAPLVLPKDVNLPPRRLNQMFLDAFDKDYQLMKCDPINSRYLACGLFVRGDVQISDINSNIARMKKDMDMVYWNQDGFKIGLCNVPPLGQPYSLLSLANNSCISDRFDDLSERFMKLFKKRVYVHHYTQCDMEMSQFNDAIQSLQALSQEYKKLSKHASPTQIPRFVPVI